MTKMDSKQNSTLRFILAEFKWDYETLINKSGKCTVELKRLRSIAFEVFRSVKNLNGICKICS